MAIKPCRECKKDVSTEAAACPHCGAVKPTQKKGALGERLAGIFGVLLILALIGRACGDDPAPQSGAAPAATAAPKREASDPEADAKCQADLQCIGDKLSMTASFLCVDDVERLAKHSVKWTDGMLDTKFTHFRWGAGKKFVTVIGDKAQFQNGFGAYTNVVYECDLSLDGKTVLDVRVREGRM